MPARAPRKALAGERRSHRSEARSEGRSEPRAARRAALGPNPRQRIAGKE